MEIVITALAGSLESNDVLVILRPSKTGTLDVSLESIVEKQFAESLKNIVTETINKHGITAGEINIQDRGALDFVIRARLETAIDRAKEGQ